MSARTISSATRRAAKPHHCLWCWQLIANGEQHAADVMARDGYIFTQRFHPECRDAMLAEAAAEGGWIEWTPGMERPLTAGELEYRSWDVAGMLRARWDVQRFREEWRRICRGSNL